MELELIFILLFIVLVLGVVASKIYETKDNFSLEFEKDVKKELKIKDSKKLLTFNKKVFTKRFTVLNIFLPIAIIFAVLVIMYLYISEYISTVTCVWLFILLAGTITMYELLTQYHGGLYQNLVLKDNGIDYVTIKYSKNSEGIHKKIQKVEFKKVYDFTIGKNHINVNGVMDYTTSKKGKLKTSEIIFYSIPRVFDEEQKIREHLKELKKNH